MSAGFLPQVVGEDHLRDGSRIAVNICFRDFIDAKESRIAVKQLIGNYYGRMEFGKGAFE